MKHIHIIIFVMTLSILSVVSQMRAQPLTLFAHWDLNENGGSTAHDAVGGYDGTLVTDAGSPAWAPGLLDFQGETHPQGRVEINTIPSLGDFGSFAIESRIRLASGGTWHRDIASEWGPQINDDDEWVFGITDTGRPRFWVRSATEPWDNIQAVGGAPLVAGEWHVLKGVFNRGQSVDLWLDGQLIASQPTTWSSIRTSAQPMWIGNMHWIGSDYHAFHGDIDYVTVWVPEPATLLLLAASGMLLNHRRSL